VSALAIADERFPCHLAPIWCRAARGIAIWIYRRQDLKGLVGRVLQRQPTASFNNRLLHLLRVNLVPSLIGRSDLETHQRYGLKGLTI
jgi:hypothetical protein